MDAAAVAEPTNYTIHPLAAIGERVSALEGTIDNQNRIFDMLHEGQKNLMVSIAELRADTDGRIAAMDTRISERINETNERIAAMDVWLNAKIDSNLKWMLGVQIAMWVTIIVAVLL